MTTPFETAHRLVGEVSERPGTAHHPFILWCHEATTLSAVTDEVPWCSSFVNRIAWLHRLPRSKSAAARSWLGIGQAIDLPQAEVGWDVVILSRGAPPAGHVGFFAGISGGNILVLGGNQGNNVTIEPFVIDRLLGIRRLKL